MLPRAASRPGLRALLALGCLVVGLLFFVARPALAYAPPPIQGHVTDLAGKLSASEKADLEQRLEGENQSSGAELAVLIVPSLQGETIEDVTYATFNAWKLGKQGKDNGVLLAIAVAERRVRIETGKGVEGQLTDLQTQDIIQQRIGPALKEDRFYDGVRAGMEAIAADVSGRPLPPPRNMPPGVDDDTRVHQFDVTFDRGTVHETVKFDPDDKIVSFRYDEPVLSK